VTPLPSKVPYTRARAGDAFIAVGPSGGGYGNPLERDPEQVRDDVLDGYISAETALRDYGVAVAAGGELDREATLRARREAGRAARIPPAP
jgi:N-methylhydantoinase B